MPIFADSLQLGLVAETVAGTTPATPAFSLITPTSESFEFTPKSQPSAAINSNRQVSNLLRLGGSSAGQISLEMQDQAVIEDLLQALLGGTWASNVLKVGSTKRTFTVEKSFLDGAGRLYQRFPFAVVDQFSLAAKTDAPVTASFDFLAKKPTTGNAIIAGATYVALADRPVMTSPTVLNVSIGGVTAYVVDGITLNLNNNFRTLSALGTDGPVDFNFGRLDCTVSFTAHFASNALLDALLANTDQAISFDVKDSANNGYSFNLPGVNLSKVRVVAGGTNTDVLAECVGTARYNVGLASTLSVTRTA